MWRAVRRLLFPVTGFCFCKSIASQELMQPKLFFLCCWMWDHHHKFVDILLPYWTWKEGMCFLMGYMEKMNLWLAVRRFRAQKMSLSCASKLIWRETCWLTSIKPKRSGPGEQHPRKSSVNEDFRSLVISKRGMTQFKNSHSKCLWLFCRLLIVVSSREWNWKEIGLVRWQPGRRWGVWIHNVTPRRKTGMKELC